MAVLTADSVKKWLAEMKSAGLAKSDAAAGRLIGKSPNTMVRYKKRGITGDDAVAIALAMRAVLHRLEPYN